MWMMSMHLHVNKKSDYDYDDDTIPTFSPKNAKFKIDKLLLRDIVTFTLQLWGLPDPHFNNIGGSL